MFSDLKKGFQVHTLDTNTVPKYELGKVVAVSEPRYLPPQPGQYQAMQTRVGGSDGRAHWRNQDLYGPGIPECG